MANDNDRKRAYTLAHQVRRFCNDNSFVVCHNAQAMPMLKVPDANGNESVFLFDRVLCDVPCSGDGTIRKNPDVLHKWSNAGAIG